MVPTIRRAVTLIEIMVVCAIVAMLLAITFPAIQLAREAARRVECRHRLRQIGVALQNYHAGHGVLPFGCGPDAQLGRGVPDRQFSGHSQLLPYLDHASTFNSINVDVWPFFPDRSGRAEAPALTGPNATAALTVVQAFLCPSDPGAAAMTQRGQRLWGHVNYRACNGSTWVATIGNGLFGKVSSTRLADVLDGTSNTAAFSEKLIGDDDDFVVTLETDLFYDQGQNRDQSELQWWCLDLTRGATPNVRHDSDSGQNWLEGNMHWTRYNHALPPNAPSCKRLHVPWDGVLMTASSLHGSGVHVLFADASVRWVGNSVAVPVWQAIATIHEGERYDGSLDY